MIEVPNNDDIRKISVLVLDSGPQTMSRCAHDVMIAHIYTIKRTCTYENNMKFKNLGSSCLCKSCW